MMSHEIQKHKKHESYDSYEEDEIDLYELIAILVKNRVTILATAILITALSLGAALYIRAKTYDKYGITVNVNYDIGNDFFLKKTGIIPNRLELQNLLKDDEVVIELFKNNKLKEIYLKNATKKQDDISVMRKFLQKRINIIGEPKEKGKELLKENLTLEFDFLEDKNLSVEIGEALFKIYNDKMLNSIYQKIDEKYGFVFKEREKYRTELDSVELKLKKLMTEEFGNNYGNIDTDQVLKLKYPKEYSNLKLLISNYDKYNEELNGLDGFKNEKDQKTVLIKTSSYYLIEVQSKAKIILAVGIVLGIALGVVLAFLKEFIEGYKKR